MKEMKKRVRKEKKVRKRITEKEVFSFDRMFPIIFMKFFFGPKNEITNKITKMDQKTMNRSPI